MLEAFSPFARHPAWTSARSSRPLPSPSRVPTRGRQDLLDAVHVALERDRAKRDEQGRTYDLRTLRRTQPRELEVMALVIAGLMNKQPAVRMGVTRAPVKVYRHNVMEKLGAKSWWPIS
jgi:FixJ family two-component response regulator